MEEKPVRPQGRGFLNCLFEATEKSPAPVQALVRQAIECHNAADLMAFYEILDKNFAKGIIDDLVVAAGIKMQHDADNYQVGTNSLVRLIHHVAIVGVIAGAHFAKEKRL